MTWSIIGQTVLNILSGRETVSAARRLVVLGHGVSRKPGRCEFRAANIIGVDRHGRDIVLCPSGSNSGQVSNLANSDGLAVFQSEMDQIPDGSLVEFLPFSIE